MTWVLGHKNKVGKQALTHLHLAANAVYPGSVHQSEGASVCERETSKCVFVSVPVCPHFSGSAAGKPKSGEGEKD